MMREGQVRWNLAVVCFTIGSPRCDVRGGLRGSRHHTGPPVDIFARTVPRRPLLLLLLRWLLLRPSSVCEPPLLLLLLFQPWWEALSLLRVGLL